jgi:hypothetical protein
MKKAIVILLLLIIISGKMYCQSNLIEGYIILLNKDTVRGWVENHDREMNPEKIRFKKNGENNLNTFFPDQILEFRSKTGLYFVSRAVRFDKSSDYVEGPIATVKSSVEASMDTVTLFLDVVIKSKLSIYHFKDKKGISHYFIELPSGTEELLDKKMKQEQTGSYIKIELYKNQLSNALSECTTIDQKIKQTSLNKKSLLNLFKEFNKCISVSSEYVQKTEKIKVQTNVVLGGSVNSLSFSSSPLNEGNFKSYSVPAGLSFEFVLPKNFKKWSLVADFLYQNMKASDDIVVGVVGGSPTKEIQIDISRISINALTKYYLNQKPTRPFLTAGLTSSYFYKIEQNYTTTFNEKKMGIGFIGGIGINFKRITIQSRFETINGVSNGQSYDSSLNSISLSVAYTL